MGIIGSAFVGYNRVYGAGNDRSIASDFIADSMFYYNLTDNYTSGDTTVTDLSPTGLNANVVSPTNYGVDGTEKYLTTPDYNGAGYIQLAGNNVEDADFSSTGVSVQHWIKPKLGHDPTNPPYFNGWPQSMFSVGQGGRLPWTMEYTATPASIYSLNDSFSVRLGNKGDTNEQADSFVYNYGASPSTITNEWRLFSLVWDCGNSYEMYIDGALVKSGTTNKNWEGSHSFDYTTTGLGFGGGNFNSEGNWNTSMLIADKLTAAEIATYYNQTKGVFGK